jgi:hypothetical protein
VSQTSFAQFSNSLSLDVLTVELFIHGLNGVIHCQATTRASNTAIGYIIAPKCARKCDLKATRK